MSTTDYEVQFGNTPIPNMVFGSDILFYLVDQYTDYKKIKDSNNSLCTPDIPIGTHNNSNSSKSTGSARKGLSPELQSMGEGEHGTAPSSDEEFDIFIDEEYSESDFLPPYLSFPPDLRLCDDHCSELKQAEAVEGVNWKFGDNQDPPDIIDHGSTHLKSDFQAEFFSTPVQSMMRFLPIGIWIMIVKESNRYAYQEMAKSGNDRISGKRWNKDITISELMIFFGIMVHMTLRPMPGKSYSDA